MPPTGSDRQSLHWHNIVRYWVRRSSYAPNRRLTVRVFKKGIIDTTGWCEDCVTTDGIEQRIDIAVAGQGAAKVIGKTHQDHQIFNCASGDHCGGNIGAGLRTGLTQDASRAGVGSQLAQHRTGWQDSRRQPETLRSHRRWHRFFVGVDWPLARHRRSAGLHGRAVP